MIVVQLIIIIIIMEIIKEMLDQVFLNGAHCICELMVCPNTGT